MAHYAIINEQNTVIAVNTGVDETVTQLDNGVEVGGSSEAWEQFYTAQLANPNLYVKRCSYHGNMRGKYPAVGDTFDADLDKFVALQPFASWTLDTNHDWQPPTPMPSTGGPYRWSEEDLEWVAV
jgi:hypothetical protein